MTLPTDILSFRNSQNFIIRQKSSKNILQIKISLCIIFTSCKYKEYYRKPASKLIISSKKDSGRPGRTIPSDFVTLCLRATAKCTIGLPIGHIKYLDTL